MDTACCSRAAWRVRDSDADWAAGGEPLAGRRDTGKVAPHPLQCKAAILRVRGHGNGCSLRGRLGYEQNSSSLQVATPDSDSNSAALSSAAALPLMMLPVGALASLADSP